MATISIKAEARFTLWWRLVMVLARLRAVWALQRLSKRGIVLCRVSVDGRPCGAALTLKDALEGLSGQGVGGIESSGPTGPPTAAPTEEIASNLQGTPPFGHV